MLIDELEKGLDSPDEEIRMQAVGRLVDVSFMPEILPALKKAMADTSWRVRKSAINIAAAFQDEKALRSILALMVDSLHSEDNAGLRNSAVEGLTMLGRKAIPYLIKNLNDNDHDVRKFIVDTIGEIWANKDFHGADALSGEEQSVVDELIKATRDADENVRLSAIEALGKIGSQKAVNILLSIVEEGDAALKFTALEALGNIGRPVPMDGVYNVLSDRLLRRAAYDLIGKVGGLEALPYLLDGLKESSTSIREAAIVAVKRIAVSRGLSRLQIASSFLQLNPLTIEKIAASLESHDLNIKSGAVFILSLLDRRETALHLIKALGFDEIADEAKLALIRMGDKGLDVLIDAYPRQSENVRGILCNILGEIGSRKAENILFRALKDNYGHVRSSAAVAIAKVNTERAIPEIVNLLEDEFDDVRDAAVDALCLVEDNLKETVISAVLPLLSTAGPSTREKVIILLGRIGGEEGIERLRLAIKDDSPAVRKAAVLAIEGMGDERYVQDIVLALADEDREVRLAAVKALGNTASREAVDSLLLTLKNEDEDDIWVKVASVESLGRIGQKDVVKAIRELVDKEEGILVIAAIEALGRIAVKEHKVAEEVRPLIARCISHNDAEVVKAAVDVLGKIGKDDIVSAVLPLLEHPNWDVRTHVVDVLSEEKTPFVRNCLEARFRIETDELVRHRILEALKGQ